ncbi:MAG: hypothetical protein A3K10_16495 [Bacteroidetes bacterium RIFCSPLOWO2_12_FULL_31_6]|nr:MAG: hypothetical protein A3K10_16495 [Bacteroidetes bacterium RIFCSPLOWO2_12_FULL_31_6]
MKYILILLITLLFLPTYAQVKSVPFNGNTLTTDQLGYYYEISNNKINKYSTDGKLEYSYSNNMLGIITNVDVSNPQKIVVYFKEFTKILILDNTLSPSSEVIDLTTLELNETTLVGRSYNDGTWYYDPIRFELIRKNQELITTNTSGNLANLLDENMQPNFLIEYNNRIYLNDKKLGILVFDIYGAYLKTIPLYDLASFQVKDKFIIYSNPSGEIETYDFFTLQKTKYQPEKYNSTSSVRVENNLIYIVDKKNQLFIDKIEY